MFHVELKFDTTLSREDIFLAIAGIPTVGDATVSVSDCGDYRQSSVSVVPTAAAPRASATHAVGVGRHNASLNSVVTTTRTGLTRTGRRRKGAGPSNKVHLMENDFFVMERATNGSGVRIDVFGTMKKNGITAKYLTENTWPKGSEMSALSNSYGRMLGDQRRKREREKAARKAERAKRGE
jgi:hypothetical protein